MKKILLLHVLLIFACSKNTQIKNPRIAIIGLGIESSTFSPATTSKEAFHAKRGIEIFDKYPFLHKDSLTRNSAEWLPILVGKALPGGIVTSEAYETLVKESLEMLKQNGPYDGVFFDIHGAMSVIGIDDAEGDLITRVRDIVGFETLISTSMDLHGNVSKLLAKQSDLITCYRMAPHEDAIESKKRAVTNLLDRLINKKGKPAYKAWIPVPILLPGEKTSTRIEPGKSLYAQVQPQTEKKGVIEKVIGPTDWCSAISFVRIQNGKMRSVLDLAQLSKYVKRTTHPFPSPRNIVASINKSSKCFAVFDAAKEYWQILQFPIHEF